MKNEFKMLLVILLFLVLSFVQGCAGDVEHPVVYYTAYADGETVIVEVDLAAGIQTDEGKMAGTLQGVRLSPDRSWLVFYLCDQEQCELYKMNLGDRDNATRLNTFTSPAIYETRISRDGQYIAIPAAASTTSENKNGIYILSSQDGRIIQFIEGGTLCAWSPSTDHLAVVRMLNSPQSGLYLVNLATGNADLLLSATPERMFSDVIWRGGDRLIATAYSSAQLTSDYVIEIEVREKKEREIPVCGGTISQEIHNLRLSPDARWLAVAVSCGTGERRDGIRLIGLATDEIDWIDTPVYYNFLWTGKGQLTFLCQENRALCIKSLDAMQKSIPLRWSPATELVQN